MGILRTILNDTITGKKRHYTYCHILENEHYPFYVGIGTHVKKATKFSRAKSASGRNQEWHDKIKGTKYFVVICNESDDYNLINQMEIEMIKYLGRQKDAGILVNISKGGNGCKGYKHTPEHIEKLKLRFSGENNPMYGKKVSDETKAKMSKAHKGRKHTEEYKLKMSVKAKGRKYAGQIGGNHHKARKVLKLDKITGETLESFDTIRLAAISLNTESLNKDKLIGRVCKNGGIAYNYKWIYGN